MLFIYLTLRAIAALNDAHELSRLVLFLVYCSSYFSNVSAKRSINLEALVSPDDNKVSSESVFPRVFKISRVRTHRRTSFSITRASLAPPSRSDKRVGVGLLLLPRRLYHNLRPFMNVKRIFIALLLSTISAVSACGHSRRRARFPSVFHFSVILKA